MISLKLNILCQEEARRKKLGIISKKYKPEDQPWLLKVGGKTGKKFKVCTPVFFLIWEGGDSK